MTDNPLANIENICFFDTETRSEPDVSASDGNLKTAGAHRYARRSFCIVKTWAIGNASVRLQKLDDFGGDWMCWADMPKELREFHKRVEQREAWYAAWNAAFDLQVWNNGTYDFPPLEPENIIDVMAQVTASNLPGDLESASRMLTGSGKQDDGKKLIAMFCSANGKTPQEAPEEWKRFLSYAVRDTDKLRANWKATRPLPMAEWEDFWISERINCRGMAVDLHFAERAAAMAEAEALRLNKELTRWTNGQITKVTQTARIAEWVYDRLPSDEARAILQKDWDENAVVDDDEDDVKIGKLSLAKDRIESLIAYFSDLEAKNGELTDAEQLIVDVVTARQFGGSSSPQKFSKMLAQNVDGALYGQYVFNGAQQTGRYSSRGVQIHNLTRDHLDKFEVEAIEFINSLEV